VVILVLTHHKDLLHLVLNFAHNPGHLLIFPDHIPMFQDPIPGFHEDQIPELTNGITQHLVIYWNSMVTIVTHCYCQHALIVSIHSQQLD